MAGATILEYYNVNIGVFSYSDEKISLIPPDFPVKVEYAYRSALNTEVYRATLVHTPLLGVFLAGNSNGVVIPYIASEREVRRLKEVFSNLSILPSKMTAVGNIILANDYAALVHPGISERDIEIIKKTLKVEVRKGRIAGIPTVGGVAVVTNRGMLVHPDASDEEIKFLEDFFSVEVDRGTVNGGNPYVKVGLVANSHGAIVGRDTTGIELAKIEQALKIIGV